MNNIFHSFFGWFPGVRILCASVSEHSVCSIFIGGVSWHHLWRWKTVHKIQTPGNRPKERIQHSKLGESLKSRTNYITYLQCYNDLHQQIAARRLCKCFQHILRWNWTTGHYSLTYIMRCSVFYPKLRRWKHVISLMWLVTSVYTFAPQEELRMLAVSYSI
jgi:hypothetical protein